MSACDTWMNVKCLIVNSGEIDARLIKGVLFSHTSFFPGFCGCRRHIFMSVSHQPLAWTFHDSLPSCSCHCLTTACCDTRESFPPNTIILRDHVHSSVKSREEQLTKSILQIWFNGMPHFFPETRFQTNLQAWTKTKYLLWVPYRLFNIK